jgi:hypothetical protein
VFLVNKILAFSFLVFRNITTFFGKPQAEIPVDSLKRISSLVGSSHGTLPIKAPVPPSGLVGF